MRAALPPPAGLDEWLAARESTYADLRAGAGKQVRWAGAVGARTPLALVYLHGFSASRQEVAPLCDELAAAFGANLFYTRLTGHGRSSAAMAECSVAAWQDDAREALAIGRLLGERVVVIGTSQGGSLATWLAVHEPDLHALVLLSPNYGPRAWATTLLRWPLAARWVPWLVGRERVVTPSNDGHAQHWTTTYPVTALFPMMELAVAARRLPVEHVTTPLLMVYSPHDQVVSARHIDAVFARFGSRPKMREIVHGSADPGAHLLAGDIFAPDTTAAVRDRISVFLGNLA